MGANKVVWVVQRNKLFRNDLKIVVLFDNLRVLFCLFCLLLIFAILFCLFRWIYFVSFSFWFVLFWLVKCDLFRLFVRFFLLIFHKLVELIQNIYILTPLAWWANTELQPNHSCLFLMLCEIYSRTKSKVLYPYGQVHALIFNPLE